MSRISKALDKLRAKCTEAGTHPKGNGTADVLECIAEHFKAGGEPEIINYKVIHIGSPADGYLLDYDNMYDSETGEFNYADAGAFMAEAYDPNPGFQSHASKKIMRMSYCGESGTPMTFIFSDYANGPTGKWVGGDGTFYLETVQAEKGLLAIEHPIESTMIVNVEEDPDTSELALDKTYSEILSAINNGVTVVLKYTQLFTTYYHLATVTETSTGDYEILFNCTYTKNMNCWFNDILVTSSSVTKGGYGIPIVV